MGLSPSVPPMMKPHVPAQNMVKKLPVWLKKFLGNNSITIGSFGISAIAKMAAFNFKNRYIQYCVFSENYIPELILPKASLL